MKPHCPQCPVTPSSYDDAHKLVTGHHPRCPEYRLNHYRTLTSTELLEMLVDEVRRLRGEMRERTAV